MWSRWWVLYLFNFMHFLYQKSISRSGRFPRRRKQQDGLDFA
jgi:hypothetical protein